MRCFLAFGQRAAWTIAPRSMKTTRSATLRARPILWVTTTIDWPSPASRSITSSTSCTISGSSADVGSSNSQTHPFQQRQGAHGPGLARLACADDRAQCQVLYGCQVREQVEMLKTVLLRRLISRWLTALSSSVAPSTSTLPSAKLSSPYDCRA